MGRPGGTVDDERVMEALQDARSDWLLRKMPKGLDSKVGRLFEGGHDLSGGEWQRLALARIMDGADADLLARVAKVAEHVTLGDIEERTIDLRIVHLK